MQKKSYYGLLKWSLLACVTTSLASACVVTTDDDGDDFFDGGEPSTSTSGKTSTGGAGSSSTAGKGGTAAGGAGASAGGTTSAGTGGSAAGAGGDPPVPGEDSGLCQGTDNPEPTSLPSCAPDDKDNDNACRKCQRASCCTAWQTCYGSEPLTACGWGADLGDDTLGQFDCIRSCYDANVDSGEEEGKIKEDCQFECLNQCEDDGLITDATNDLFNCTVDNCNTECFPPPSGD
jgi:hypothetical protein